MRRDTPTFNETLNQLKEGSAKVWMLLVGVNQYQQPLKSLQFAVADCQGLEEALVETTKQFPNKEVLLHCDNANLPPTLKAVSNSVQRISREANWQDVVIFYFAGHGEVELPNDQLFLCLQDTHKGKLHSTSLDLERVLQQLYSCNARQHLVLLDACRSGNINLLGRARGGEEELGRQEELEESSSSLTQTLVEVVGKQVEQTIGRDICAILACDRDQISWEHPNLQHGVFSYYLIQGLKGKAVDNDGVISSRGLEAFVGKNTRLWVQQYIDGKRQNPRCFTNNAYEYNIVLGFSPTSNYNYEQKLSYEQKFSRYKEAVDKGIRQKILIAHQIDNIITIADIIDEKIRQKLKTISHSFGLIIEDIEAAEQEIFRRYKGQINSYKQQVIELLEQQYPLTEDALKQLNDWRQRLVISLANATAIRERLTQVYEQKLQQYREAFQMALYQQGLPHDKAHQQLQGLQQELDLSAARVQRIEAEVIANYQGDRQWCQQRLEEAIRQLYPLNSEGIERVLSQQKQDLEQERGLNPMIIASISAGVVARYRQYLQYYRETYTRIKQCNPLNNERNLLENLRRFLANETVNIIQAEVDYEDRFTQVIQQQYPGLPSGEFLENFRNANHLSQEITDSIETKVLEKYRLNSPILPVEEDSESSPPYSRKLVTWIASDCQDTSQLLQGQELKEALNWLDTQNLRRLNQQEQEFIRKSLVWNWS